LDESYLRALLRSGPVPHAAVRPRHGAGDDLAAARAHLVPPAVDLPARGQAGARRHGARGIRLMAAPAARQVPLLRVEHLTMRFGGLVAIDNLSFEAARGDITALIGPNGAGKTTVFNCITGFYKPTCGRMLLSLGEAPAQVDIDALTQSGARSRTLDNGALFLLERMPDYEIAAKAHVARTFQNIRLFSGMTVLENLIVA